MLCAGTGGKITREDVLLAGAIVARLTAPAGDRNRSVRAPNRPVAVNDQAAIARDAWLLAVAEPGEPAAGGAARQGAAPDQGGRNLAALVLRPTWPTRPRSIAMRSCRGSILHGPNHAA